MPNENTNNEVFSTLGLRDVVIALLTTDNAGAAPVYGTVEPLVGAIDFDISENGGDPDVQYYDDHEGHVIYPDPEWQGTLELADLPPAGQAKLLGSEIDSNGVLIRNANDRPPYFAMGFKSEKANGEDRYVWLYKCRARLTQQKFTTKQGDTVNRQTSKLQITAIKRTCDQDWQATVDSDDEAFASVKATFFTSVYQKTVSAGG